MITKPPLNEVYLAHAGVKGMRWGHRKKRPDEAERAKFFNKENFKKAGKTAAVVAGVAIVAGVMTQAGRTRMTDVAVTNYAQTRTAKITAAKTPLSSLGNLYKTSKSAVVNPNPMYFSPQTRRSIEQGRLRLQSQNTGLSQLVDKTWRDQARMSQMIKEMDKPTNPLIDRLLNNGSRLADGNTQALGNAYFQRYGFGGPTS